ncbi:MAG: hypothetical protein UY79_C0007G0007 [Parcubacteria group bacterium GW2011_GWA2_53_21]|nr:MAG: hypothetical protein UY79_C0007G0007 [Parcubacteria group bacterium GW2011_GWA2_53_21]
MRSFWSLLACRTTSRISTIHLWKEQIKAVDIRKEALFVRSEVFDNQVKLNTILKFQFCPGYIFLSCKKGVDENISSHSTSFIDLTCLSEFPCCRGTLEDVIDHDLPLVIQRAFDIFHGMSIGERSIQDEIDVLSDDVIKKLVHSDGTGVLEKVSIRTVIVFEEFSYLICVYSHRWLIGKTFNESFGDLCLSGSGRSGHKNRSWLFAWGIQIRIGKAPNQFTSICLDEVFGFGGYVGDDNHTDLLYQKHPCYRVDVAYVWGVVIAKG